MEKLLKILEELHPDVDFKEEEHLVEDMILDSFDLVSLISEIKEVFDIDIAAKDMIPEDRKSTRLNSSHDDLQPLSRMPSSA